MTVTNQEELVVFLIGMRVNKVWKVQQWVPIAGAMTRMLKELHQHPEMGRDGLMSQVYDPVTMRHVERGVQELKEQFRGIFSEATVNLARRHRESGTVGAVITVADRLLSGMTTATAAFYVLVQLAGAALGAVVANLMFSLPAVEISTKVRLGAGLWLAEGVATFGLVLVVLALVRSGRSALAAPAVGVYIAAYLPG